MDDLKWLIWLSCIVTFAATLGYIADRGFETWQAVESARLRCAPSAAPATSAP